MIIQALTGVEEFVAVVLLCTSPIAYFQIMTPEEVAEAFLTEGGEIQTPSGTLLPERDNRIASGERPPKFEGLAGYGISPRFRVDSRDEPGGVSAYAVGSRFKLDVREIVINRHSAESQSFVLDLR